MGDRPLSVQYPSLFNISRNKNALVAEVLSEAPPVNVEFRRTLTGGLWDAWLNLVQRLMSVNLSNEETPSNGD